MIPFLNPAHLRNVPRDFVQAGMIYSLPLITIAAASAFGWLLAYLRGPIVVSGWIGDIAGDDPHMIMFLLVLVFVIVGDFIEPIPAIIIFMPVVNAADRRRRGSTRVHMGVVLIVTLAFGLITPPYGLALLMASKFVDVRFSQALRASLPIYVIFFATIAFTIFLPDVGAVAAEARCFRSRSAASSPRPEPATSARDMTAPAAGSVTGAPQADDRKRSVRHRVSPSAHGVSRRRPYWRFAPKFLARSAIYLLRETCISILCQEGVGPAW